jgi:5-methylcytosine-specific restriction endonuclease McrA
MMRAKNYKDTDCLRIGKAQHRAFIWRKTSGRCWYCGLQTVPWQDFCVDHVIPKSNGGSDESKNLVPCCLRCNIIKKNNSISEFRNSLAKSNNMPSIAYKFYYEQQGFKE